MQGSIKVLCNLHNAFLFLCKLHKGFIVAGVRVGFVQVAQRYAISCATCTMCSGCDAIRFVQHAQMVVRFCATCTKK